MPASHESSASALAMVKLDDIILGANAQIVFSSIPQNYTHLKIVAQLRGAQAVTDSAIRWRINGDTGNNYHSLRSDLINAAFSSLSSPVVNYMVVGRVTGDTATANYYTAHEMTFMNYRDTSSFKTGTGIYTGSRGTASGDQFTGSGGGIWLSTAAIVSLTLWQDSGAGEYKTGSRATLYGLA